VDDAESVMDRLLRPAGLALLVVGAGSSRPRRIKPISVPEERAFRRARATKKDEHDSLWGNPAALRAST